jgi:hypothetical protein
VSLRAAELGRCAGVYRPVRTGCVAFADDPLTMIMLSATPECRAGWHLTWASAVSLIGRPLGRSHLTALRVLSSLAGLCQFAAGLC